MPHLPGTDHQAHGRDPSGGFPRDVAGGKVLATSLPGHDVVEGDGDGFKILPELWRQWSRPEQRGVQHVCRHWRHS